MENENPQVHKIKIASLEVGYELWTESNTAAGMVQAWVAQKLVNVTI